MTKDFALENERKFWKILIVDEDRIMHPMIKKQVRILNFKRRI